ncbi:Crp/Fnr family transcriptional regulator [Pedobacter caeni]|uniref:cAMP-binding domain of CRP or a regulatory subunit of cAMP-dependent protein kinases n=1 Tax=Pedobacter caeni TaxID=288992 RepID=A0A1M5EYR5_9SPHI|nr:Crp/Fnr family transcriptional regulator [Pedobacter caeni]SHF84182.1 cAMP-binding domain of CRP or a regulatory subunit of cAMP-dependent protein kinases [Pedobacter caeni]
MEAFWQYIKTYTAISDAAQRAWQQLLQEKTIAKNEYFLMEGSIPKRIAYVKKGLFSYYYTDKDGATVIKKFFPEQTLVASTSAMLLQQASLFTIQALEETEIISYSFEGFRELTLQYPDIARFYIHYMEQHWIIEKEIGEITLKYQTAKQRYLDFRENNLKLFNRLKQHHMASYLGVTPTQLSRIRAEL